MHCYVQCTAYSHCTMTWTCANARYWQIKNQAWRTVPGMISCIRTAFSLTLRIISEATTTSCQGDLSIEILQQPGCSSLSMANLPTVSGWRGEYYVWKLVNFQGPPQSNGTYAKWRQCRLLRGNFSLLRACFPQGKWFTNTSKKTQTH